MIGPPLSRRAVLATLAFLVTSPAMAHGLNVSLESDAPGAPGGQVSVVAYFDDDTPAQAAKVVVTENDGTPVVQGSADERGRWAFARPAPGRYRIVVDAAGGHRVHANLVIPAEASASAGIDTPSRAEFTRFPWIGIGAGVGLLAFLAGVSWFVRRRRTEGSAESSIPATS
jgi:nickel transport protein